MQLKPGDCDRQFDYSTIKKLPRNGNGGPARGTDGPVRGTEGQEGLFYLQEAILIAPVPLTVLIVGVRADL